MHVRCMASVDVVSLHHCRAHVMSVTGCVYSPNVRLLVTSSVDMQGTATACHKLKSKLSYGRKICVFSIC